MPIRLHCGSCQATFTVRDELAGRKGRCPQCGQIILIPQQGEASGVSAVPTEPARAQQAPPTGKVPNGSRGDRRLDSPIQRPSGAAEGRASALQNPSQALPAGARDIRSAAGYGDLSEEERRRLSDLVLGGFQGAIQPVRRPATYHASMLCCLAILLVLPLCYVALIGLTGYGIYLHAVYAPHWLFGVGLRGQAALLALLAYVGPMAAGGILLLFMVKPFFAPRPKLPTPLSLLPDTDPLLFAFVKKVCHAVHAPLPRRIDVDCQVNASASFRRGVLSFVGNDLVLTVGMPLVGGLTMKQFAGVLAHEFGHFSQGGGMRLSYLVRSVAAWFHRIATERDAWDEWLISTSSSVDLRIGVFLYMARFFVFCCRKILYLLMLAGWSVVGVLLREMEYDADRHETRLAGSDTFCQTVARLRRLSLASSMAEEAVNRLFQEGRLPDDFPALVLEREAHIPPNLWQAVEEEAARGTTHWYSTHPCDRDRIQAALKERAPGVFLLELPARLLFADFSAVCRNATVEWYKYLLEDAFKPDMLYPVEEFIRRLERSDRVDQAFRRFFQGVILKGRFLPLVEIETARPVGELIDAIRLGRRVAQEQRGQYEQLAGKYRESLHAEVASSSILFVLENERKAGSQNNELNEAIRELKENYRKAYEDRQSCVPEISKWETQVMCRLTAALRLLATPQIQQRCRFDDALINRVKQLASLYRRLEKHDAEVVHMEREADSICIAFSVLENRAPSEHTLSALTDRIQQVAVHAKSFLSHFENIPYPLEHAQQGITVAQYFCNAALSEEPATALQQILMMVEQIYNLQAGLLAELIAVAEEVERALGMEPLAEPEIKLSASE
ncbi:MAG: hypothetical protein KatS3mg110_4489 [Pirellulaceae bacterium]|nr:MAG: hypothetical protein KatS3mg110_4489 [Pirellulaceae bacterium]